MLFNTTQFGVFLVLVLGAYWALARYHTLRLGFLLLASYGFYACWKPAYLFLILGVTIAD